MKITVVVDNSVPPGSKFLGEHGLSMLLELNDRRILLDTGQSGIPLLHNLSLMGLHPEQLDAIVLSHGHHDHAGGLEKILQYRQKRIPVYGHSQIFTDHYVRAGEKLKFGGIPAAKERLSSLGADWQFSDRPLEIVPSLWFSGQIPRVTDYETGDTKLVLEQNGCECQDQIEDDATLFYKSPDGLVVISGCAHSGFVNTVVWGKQVTGENRLAGWIGGTHLGPVAASQQQATLAEMEHLAPSFIAANHCTGFAMMCGLKRIFADKFIPAFAGTVVEC